MSSYTPRPGAGDTGPPEFCAAAEGKHVPITPPRSATQAIVSELRALAARVGGAGDILADPPIPFVTWSPKGEGRSPQQHYRCAAFDELAALPVASVAAPHSFLFLWIPLRSVFLVEPLMRAWGFKFSGAG